MYSSRGRGFGRNRRNNTNWKLNWDLKLEGSKPSFQFQDIWRSFFQSTRFIFLCVELGPQSMDNEWLFYGSENIGWKYTGITGSKRFNFFFITKFILEFWFSGAEIFLNYHVISKHVFEQVFPLPPKLYLCSQVLSVQISLWILSTKKKRRKFNQQN